MFRLFSFPELMRRLDSNTWEVVKMEGGFVFVPCMYRDYGVRFLGKRSGKKK